MKFKSRHKCPLLKGVDSAFGQNYDLLSGDPLKSDIPEEMHYQIEKLKTNPRTHLVYHLNVSLGHKNIFKSLWTLSSWEEAAIFVMKWIRN